MRGRVSEKKTLEKVQKELFTSELRKKKTSTSSVSDLENAKLEQIFKQSSSTRQVSIFLFC